ncbi:MAG: chemotaxis protein CheD [Candidatus Omnitrophota bacterium]
MAKFIHIATGEVKVSSTPFTLRVPALGSCIAVIAYDYKQRIGGLAHVMLPGKSPRTESLKTKYAEDAIGVLFDAMRKSGAKPETTETSLLGGANMLGEGDLPEKIAESVLGYLKKLDIKPGKMRLGGSKRRSASLRIRSGKIFYTEGDSAAREL